MKYNHNRPLSDFEKQIQIIKKNGFKLIGVSQIYFEDTFVFETSEEALNAYNLLEKSGKITGWWYGKKDFEDVVQEYELKNEGYSKVLIYWI